MPTFEWVKEHGWLSLPALLIAGAARALLKRVPNGDKVIEAGLAREQAGDKERGDFIAYLMRRITNLEGENTTLHKILEDTRNELAQVRMRVTQLEALQAQK